jgi:hypothetical protein
MYYIKIVSDLIKNEHCKTAVISAKMGIYGVKTGCSGVQELWMSACIVSLNTHCLHMDRKET